MAPNAAIEAYERAADNRPSAMGVRVASTHCRTSDFCRVK